MYQVRFQVTASFERFVFTCASSSALVTGRSFFSHGMECSVTPRPVSSGQVEVVVHTQKKDGQIFAFGAGDRIRLTNSSKASAVNDQ